nr:glycosyltransferase [Halobacillus salinus]
MFLPSLRGGGAERVMLNLANNFCEKGYEVDLILAKAEGPYLKDLHRSIKIINLGAKKVSRSLVPLIKYLQKEKPESLLCAMNYANVIALVAVKIARVRTEVSVAIHSVLSKGDNFQEKVVLKLMKAFYKDAKNIIAVSNGVADQVRRYLSIKEIVVIYNPVLTDNTQKKASEFNNHKWFNNNQKVVLSAGRMNDDKNFQLLIRAFKLVRNEIDSKLIILGEGTNRNKLTSIVRDNGLQSEVDMPGFVNNPYSYMRNSSLFVLPSNYESFGNVIVEALTSGTNVVSTDCPYGPREILEDGKYGTLVPVNDVELLANSILNNLKEPKHHHVEEFAKKSNKYHIDFVTEKYIDILF